MKILVVDDHEVVRKGLSHILRELDEQVEVLQAGHCSVAYELAHAHPDIDLVLLDYEMPDISGLDALDFFGKKYPELPIVILSGMASQLLMRQAMNKGAAAIIAKAGPSHELLQTLRRVLEGEIVPPKMLTGTLLSDASNADKTSALCRLTPRQEQVLYLLLDGLTTRAISERLHLSEETTKAHISAIIRTCGAKTRLEAILAAGRYGYVKSTRSD